MTRVLSTLFYLVLSLLISAGHALSFSLWSNLPFWHYSLCWWVVECGRSQWSFDVVLAGGATRVSEGRQRPTVVVSVLQPMHCAHPWRALLLHVDLRLQSEPEMWIDKFSIDQVNIALKFDHV